MDPHLLVYHVPSFCLHLRLLNCDEGIFEEIYDSSLNKKHDCNDFTINSLDVNCANNMQNPKLGCRCQNRRISGRGS